MHPYEVILSCRRKLPVSGFGFLKFVHWSTPIAGDGIYGADLEHEFGRLVGESEVTVRRTPPLQESRVRRRCRFFFFALRFKTNAFLLGISSANPYCIASRANLDTNSGVERRSQWHFRNRKPRSCLSACFLFPCTTFIGENT